jgi:hypothetical protein
MKSNRSANDIVCLRKPERFPAGFKIDARVKKAL